MLDVRPSLRDRKKDATRQAIEDAAWELFTTNGFDETTVQEIADRANVAPRTFFRYFPSKEAVLYPELDDLMARLGAAFAERPRNESVVEALLNAIDEVNESASADAIKQSERHKMLKRSAKGSMSDFAQARIAGAIADMVRERYAADPDVELRAQLTAAIVSTVSSTANERWLSAGAQGEMDDEMHHCMGVLRSILA